MRELTFTVENEEHLISLRNTIKKQATDLKMSLLTQTKLMTAANELGRNMIRYGRGGQVTVAIRARGSKSGIQLVFADRGPGIPDLEKAMQDGYSTQGGLGLGLPGTRRLVDEFRIDSAAGQGTTVTITKW